MSDEPPKKKTKKKKRVRWVEIPPNEISENMHIFKIPVDHVMAEESEHDLVIDTDREDNLPSGLETLENDLEKQLEEKAKKNNLSVTNVKNILKAVITNKDVVDMVNTSLKGETFDNYRPKFTRSKTKELLDTFDLEQMGSKKSDYAYILEQELSDHSSDDEEYTPNEESDEENKTAELVPESPVPDSPYISSLCGDEEYCAENIENIGQRTRSKLSLSETPLEAIEQQFVPPDITTDMYDTECDNQDWLDFLKDIQNPLNRTSEVIEEENDPEYNVMVEDSIEHMDFEELRHDRAVKVTKAELHALMNEWFGCEDFSSEDEVDPLIKKQAKNSPIKSKLITPPSNNFVSPPLLPPPQPSSRPQNSSYLLSQEEIYENLNIYKRDNFFAHEQYVLLRQQLQQHIQLLLQTFLLTHKHSFVESNVPYKCKEMLVSLKSLADTQISSTFNVLNVQSSLDLLQKWELCMSNNKFGSSVTQFMEKEYQNGDTKRKKRSIIPAKLPPQLMSFCADSTAFIYPLLLPDVGIMFTTNKSGRPPYSHHENHLIALGLEEFIKLYNSSHENVAPKLIEICRNISSCLMPHREPRSIMSHIKWLTKDSGPNVIKYYYKHNVTPPIKHFVVHVDKCVRLRDHPYQLIPPNWKKHLFKNYSISCLHLKK